MECYTLPFRSTFNDDEWLNDTISTLTIWFLIVTDNQNCKFVIVVPLYAQFNNWHFQFDSFNEFFSALFVLSHFFSWMNVNTTSPPTKIQVLKVANYSKGSSMMILYWQRKHVPYLYGKYVKVLIIFIQNQSYILIWKYVFVFRF